MKIFGYTALEGYFVRPTGVGKHIDQMFHGLAAAPDFDFSILTACDQVTADGKAPAEHPLADLPISVMPHRRRVAEWRWLLTGSPKVDPWVSEADWVYCPYPINAPTRQHRLAITIHSLYHFDRDWPQYRSWHGIGQRLRFSHMYNKVMREGDLLLTVSEFVRDQMIQWYDLAPEKVKVVGNGVEPDYYAAGLLPACPPANGRPYVVCVSGLNELDGAAYVLEVAAELLKQDPEIEVVVAGHQHQPQFLEKAKELSNIRLLGYVKREALAKLMRDSVALLFLNRYESFGIGAAEAMAARTPVIGTHFTAVPEIVGGAGIVVDVTKPVEIAEQVVQWARTPSLRDHYIALGHERAALFTWDACVDRLVGALR